MYINLTEAGEQRQRAIVEEVIKRASPGVKLRWGQKGSTETHVLLVKIHGRRYRLEISQDALDATEDPADLHRL